MHRTMYNNTVKFNYRFSLSVQITAYRHAIKTDRGVGVAAVGNTCYDILVMVANPTNKCGSTVS